MENKDWRANLKDLFEGFEIIEMSQKEAREKFSQFREMIAEPAFELLSEELKEYRVKSFYTKSKGNTIHFWISFPRSGKDCFHYTIYLPKNFIDLNLKLRLRGRRTKKSIFIEREENFMEHLSPSDILKMSSEDLVQNFILHYRNFRYELHTRPE